jgi:hypothetical protein
MGLYWGPAGGGGGTGGVERCIRVTDAFLPREEVRIESELIKS